MERTVVWSRVDLPGTEILQLKMGEQEIAANSVALSVDEAGEPFELHYTLALDPNWQAHRVTLMLTHSGEKKSLELRLGPDAKWRLGIGRALPELEGCPDVDISATPFTNTLPIRRLRLPVGASREIAVAYLAVPSLRIARRHQRYTHLESTSGADRYLFESLPGGFRAELLVDADGLVVEYPGLFARFQPSP